MALLELRRPRHSDRQPPTAERPTTASTFRPDIEGLRAVAVLLVVLFHAGVTVLSGGYVGVDVFFVISGFLITSQLLRELDGTGRISITAFYGRRALRLLPASLFVVAATLAAVWLWLPPLRVNQIATDALTTTFYGLNVRLAVQGTDYLGATAAPSPLQHFWSLAVEEQFYLVWPLILMATAWLWQRRRNAGDVRPAVFAVLTVVIAGSFTLSVWQTAVSAPWAYFGAHTRAWELAVGAAIAVAAPLLSRIPARAATAGRWLGLAGIGVAALCFTEATAFPGYAAALPVLATGLVIAVGCAQPSSVVLGVAPLQTIGRLSYSWYLWHWPVLIVGPIAFGALTIWQNLGLLGMSLLLAMVTARQVENPLRHKAWLRRRPLRAIGLGFGLSAMVAALALVMPAILPSTTGTLAGTDVATALTSRTAAEKNLAELVDAGTRNNDVPANLTPTLDLAKKDIGQIYADGCDPTFLESDVKKPCLYGDPKAKKIMVLFGDSHAGQWFPALDAIARKRNLRLAVVTKSACNAATVSIVMNTLKRPYTECDTWRQSAIAYINSLEPAYVVMSSNGHGTGLNLGDQDEGWAAGWTTTFEQVSGGKLVLISDTAWPESDVPDCVSNNITTLTECHRAASGAFADGRRRELIADAARGRGGIVVDPADWMCTEKLCPVVIGNVLVYKDDSHISATFSRLLSPLVEQRIFPAK